MDNAMLKIKGWLKRDLEIPTSKGILYFNYSGRGFGTEKVVVNGKEIVAQSEYGWFVPRFDFEHEGHNYEVQTRVWPWVSLRTLEIKCDGKTIYLEGREPYLVSRTTEILQLFIFFVVFLGPLFLMAMFLGK